MRYDEALRMADWIRGLSLPAGSVCLNIGSSTERFRVVSQPHIDGFLFAPLREAGVRVIHCDMKADPGVDMVGDVFDPEFRQRLKDIGADLLVCSNLLEHLTDPHGFASACASLVGPGAYALFTVPAYYPYHPDPIDTMFRPSPVELSELFPGWSIVRAEEMESGNFWTDLSGSKHPWRKFAHYFLRLATPFYRPRIWLAYAHRGLWLFRKYRISLLLIQRPLEHSV